MVKKKGFLKKTGCILISASIILTGWTFFGSTISEAGGTWDGTTYNATGTIAVGEVDGYQSSMTAVVGSGDLSVADNALADCTALKTVSVAGNLNLGSYSLAGDTALTSVTCSTMTGASATSFLGCKNIAFSISNGSTSGYYIYNKALYNGTTLVYIPASAVTNNKYTIKEGTTVLGAYAFDDTSISQLSFENNSASSLTKVEAQTDWPEPGTHINVTGASADSYVVDFFSTKCNNAGTIILDGATPTYKITVKDVATTGETIETYYLYKEEGKALTINAKSHDGYTISGESSKTITTDAEDTLTFYYTKNDTPTTTYSVTVVEQTSDGATVFKNETNNYAAGATITASDHDGYTVSGTSTYTVTTEASQKVIFNYTKNSEPGPTPTPTPGPSPSGGGGGGGGSSSSGTTTASTTTVTSDAQANNCYVITEGAGQIVGQNDGPVRIVCNGPVEKFVYLLVDGNVVDKANYTIQSGSTILTMTKEYIASLPVGDHAVQFQYTDGYAITGLKTTAAATGRTTTTVTYRVSSDGSISSGHTQDNTPKTADGFDNRYILCFAIFLLGAGIILFSRQRKLEALLADQRDEY